MSRLQNNLKLIPTLKIAQFLSQKAKTITYKLDEIKSKK